MDIKMKCIVILILFFSTFNALDIDRVEVIDGPNVNISRIIITWKKDKNDSDDVLGYKVKIWEKPRVKRIVYKSTENGVFQPFIEFQDPPISLNNLPKGEPLILKAKANETYVLYDGVRINVHYEIRVSSFNKNGEGPISAPLGIKISAKEEIVTN